MRRRSMGAALIAGAVLLAVAVPFIGGRSVAGSAQPIAVRMAPSIGDCVLSPIDNEAGSASNGGVMASGDDAVEIGPCQGPRYGEVVAVLNAGTPHPAGQGAGLDGGAVSSFCSQAAAQYQGMPTSPPPVDPAGAVSWFPSIPIYALAMRTDAIQRAAGQSWTACVTALISPGDELAPYSESVRDTYTTGAPPPGAGQCIDLADDQTGSLVPCDLPHTVEDFGLASSSSPDTTDADRADLQGTCLQLVAALTRMSDPTGGGVLTVIGEPTHIDQDTGRTLSGADPDPQNGQSWRCRVLAPTDRTLSATLIGLGERPLPWT